MGSWIGPAASLLGIGWYFATCIILGIVIGHWADTETGLEPLITLVGTFIGLAVALVGGIRMLMPVLNQFGNNDQSAKDRK